MKTDKTEQLLEILLSQHGNTLDCLSISPSCNISNIFPPHSNWFFHSHYLSENIYIVGNSIYQKL